MGLLDGDLAPVVAGAFNWLLLDGTLHGRALADDGKGGFTEGAAPADVAIKVMVDPADETMRREDDFNERDVSLLVLANGVPWPTLDNEISVATGAHAGRYHILPPLRLDAAQTHYVMRGRKL